MDLLPNRLDHLVRSVRDPAHAVSVSAGHADHLARRTDGGAEEPTFVARVANRELLVLAPAAVADGGRSSPKGAPGVLEGAHDRVRRIELLERRHRIRLTVKQEVDVAVDEARHHGGAAAIEHVPGKAVELALGGDPGNPPVLHEHGVAVRHPLTVEDPTCAVERVHSLWFNVHSRASSTSGDSSTVCTGRRRTGPEPAPNRPRTGTIDCTFRRVRQGRATRRTRHAERGTRNAHHRCPASVRAAPISREAPPPETRGGSTGSTAPGQSTLATSVCAKSAPTQSRGQSRDFATSYAKQSPKLSPAGCRPLPHFA